MALDVGALVALVDVVEHGQVVDRTDADPASRERGPDAVPLVDVLEADEFLPDVPALEDEHAAGDGDAGALVFGLGALQAAAVRGDDLGIGGDVIGEVRIDLTGDERVRLDRRATESEPGANFVFARFAVV